MRSLILARKYFVPMLVISIFFCFIFILSLNSEGNGPKTCGKIGIFARVAILVPIAKCMAFVAPYNLATASISTGTLNTNGSLVS